MKQPSRQQRLGNGHAPSQGTSAPKGTAARVVDPYKHGYDIILVNGPIDESLQIELQRCISQRFADNKGKRNTKIVVALVTYGGLPNSAFKIGRFLQSMYEEVVCFVPSQCKSAGTLIVTAGHKLVMSSLGEIGPYALT
jgi:membrane-bound ClpP family serine protease